AECGSNSFRAGISRTMKCSVYHPGLLADILHDIDLAALRPFRLVNVVAHHPERRPDSLTIWNLDARLKAPVFLAELPLCLKPCGCVVAGNSVGAVEFFREHFDD